MGDRPEAPGVSSQDKGGGGFPNRPPPFTALCSDRVRQLRQYAAGYTSAADVVVAWMQSEGHRRNILNPDVREIGAGYSTNPQSAYTSYWVNVYAAR